MSPPPDISPRRRLPREERTRQLLAKAWQLIGEEGTDALTLGRLADAAGVTKPVVYDHFSTRNGLLAALYQDYDARQTAIFDAAVEAAAATLQDKARVIATSYVNCVLTQGREISGVVAALTGSPELAAVKKQYQHAFIAKCAALLAPFCASSGISSASLWAMLGAADALSDAAVADDLSEAQAQHELQAIILGMVERNG
ncbi:TetR family transcriptional regulator [Xanthomonas arboricola pv. zantedeschiae]|uniref:TetR/AcrR family transcriptional regulator n=1 Tax=Xanthomonas arboricola TaxID=56448 RepID=UPI000CEDCAFB|nr:TetR/AcrR family transcriptional regulator [Xanthomonas arboricola]PPT80383.1 TetR family transcriptional regulator [Xanthomonas arboricola pv. zantedeschiae]